MNRCKGRRALAAEKPKRMHCDIDGQHCGLSNVEGCAFNAYWEFPWRQPISHYDDGGLVDIKTSLIFEMKTLPGVKFQVTRTDERGIDTGRTRWKVSCMTCAKELHEATTGPCSRAESHAREKHGWEDCRPRCSCSYKEGDSPKCFFHGTQTT